MQLLSYLLFCLITYSAFAFTQQLLKKLALNPGKGTIRYVSSVLMIMWIDQWSVDLWDDRLKVRLCVELKPMAQNNDIHGYIFRRLILKAKM